jgi:hypothetical protein
MADQSMGPALIDFHDAVIRSITLQGDSSAIISFDTLNFFYPTGPDEYEVWECAAGIVCYGVQAFEVSGRLNSNTCVWEGSMLDAQQREVPTLAADESPITSMSLTLMSGTNIRLSMESAKLDTFKRVKLLERWIGPLR